MPDDNNQEEQETQVGTFSFSNIDYSQTRHTRFYSNHVAGQITFFDVRLLLSSVHVADNKLFADETFHLIMTPEFATVLKQTLDAALQNFTAVYGPPRQPSVMAVTTPETKQPETGG
jgi:hypothetical protein